MFKRNKRWSDIYMKLIIPLKKLMMIMEYNTTANHHYNVIKNIILSDIKVVLFWFGKYYSFSSVKLYTTFPCQLTFF